MLDLEKLIQDSVRDRNKTATLTYQAIKAEKQKAISAKNAKPYDDIAEIAIIRKLVNQHRDSIEQYKQANRPDLVADEQAELDILQTFLPPEVQPETLQEALTLWCEEQGYEKLTQKEIGIAIKALKAQYPSADGKLIADVVKKSLTM